MSTNEETITRYVNELNKRNYSIIDEVVSDKPTVEGKEITRDEYRQHILHRIQQYPDYHVTILSIEPNGNTVKLHWHRTGTAAANGEKLDEEITSEYTIENGKIIEVK